MEEKTSKSPGGWLISILMMLIATPRVFAIDYSENGINYALNETDKTAEVTGGTAIDIIIPEKVTYEGNDYIVKSIKANAFSNKRDYKSLVLPNSLTTIGESAFSNCRGLSDTLNIPNSVTSIGNYAFRGCSGFTGTLTIPTSITTIGTGVFDRCSGFNDSLVIPNTVTSIGDYAFRACSGFKGSLDIPESVNYIGNFAFSGCSGFKNVNSYALIPPTVANNNAFSDYSIPLNVAQASLGDYKMADVWKEFITIQPFITTVDYNENGLNYILNEQYLTAELTGGTAIDIIIPEKVTYEGNDYIVKSIKEKAFMDRTDCKSLVLPNSLTTIGDMAFRGCRWITGSLTIPDSVTYIGESAFRYCQGLTGSLTIPNSVTYIGGFAFDECSGFTGTLTISNSVTAIEAGVFSGCNGFTGQLIIPETVTSIDSYAFKNCWNFTGTLTIPPLVTKIGIETFAGCSRLTGPLTIPDFVTVINAKAFLRCSSLTGPLTLSSSLSRIESQAFEGCYSLTGQLNIPNSVTAIGASAFEGCSELTGPLNIPNLVTYIGDSAFEGCSELTGSLTLPNSVTYLGSKAFYDCSSLTGSLVIPKSVTSIENGTFDGCSGFTDTLTIPESVTSIGEYAFNKCNGFYNVNCYAIVPPLVGNSNSFSDYHITLNVPKESLEDYKAAEVWKKFSTINPIVAVENVTLDRDKADVKVGESIQLVATVMPEDAYDKGVVWASSNEAVATVDANGMVKGVAEGYATVTATAWSGVSASCEITVIPAMGLVDEELAQPDNRITPKAGGVNITIDATSDTRVDIANMAGMIVESFVVPAGTFVSTDYDAESLAPGFYVVSATSAENRITKRIVIR